MKKCIWLLLLSLPIYSAQFELWSKNNQIITDKNITFNIKGISWYGLESSLYCFTGLNLQNMEYILDSIKNNNFNFIRIPISMELAYNLDPIPTISIEQKNPLLNNKTSLEILDYMILESGKRGILIMIDFHQLFNRFYSDPLWYDINFPEIFVLEAIQNIASRYNNVWNVVAYDLKNEPHYNATWGTGLLCTDWMEAAERLGNAVLVQNPKPLIFVQGIDGISTNWGGNLSLATRFPVNLNIKNKIVLSPHVYGPDIRRFDWYRVEDMFEEFSINYGPVWQYLLNNDNYPGVVLGEWSISNDAEDISRQWNIDFIEYLNNNSFIDNFYWSIDPDIDNITRINKGYFESDWIRENPLVLTVTSQVNPIPSEISVTKDTVTLYDQQYNINSTINPNIPNYMLFFTNRTDLPQKKGVNMSNLLPLYIIGGMFILSMLIGSFVIISKSISWSAKKKRLTEHGIIPGPKYRVTNERT